MNLSKIYAARAALPKIFFEGHIGHPEAVKIVFAQLGLSSTPTLTHLLNGIDEGDVLVLLRLEEDKERARKKVIKAKRKLK